MKTELFYLSFGTEAGWLGAVFVEAQDFKAAVRRAWDLGINPGGEVLGFVDERPIDRRWWNRVLTRAEVDEAIKQFGDKTVHIVTGE